MYRIAVLTPSAVRGQDCVRHITRFCREVGRFPQVAWYADEPSFFAAAHTEPPSGAVILLPGVEGLNAAEHLRAVYPECGLLWCSDLDFSLHAFRLRADYFWMEPMSPEKLRQGLEAWLENTKRGGIFR